MITWLDTITERVLLWTMVSSVTSLGVWMARVSCRQAFCSTNTACSPCPPDGILLSAELPEWSLRGRILGMVTLTDVVTHCVALAGQREDGHPMGVSMTTDEIACGLAAGLPRWWVVSWWAVHLVV